MSLDLTLTMPNTCPHCHEPLGTEEILFEWNVTHNLGRMAKEAGFYECLWRAPESGYTHAGDIISRLREGVKKMKADPGRYRAFDPPNGWGSYHDFMPLIEGLLRMCIEHPKAHIRTCR